MEGEELDVEVLRIGVCTEGWQCLTDNDACDMNDAFEVLRLPLPPRHLSRMIKLDTSIICKQYLCYMALEPGDSLSQASQPLSTAPRLDQAELAGDYNVFDVSAVPVEDTDPFTGEAWSPCYWLFSVASG